MPLLKTLVFTVLVPGSVAGFIPLLWVLPLARSPLGLGTLRYLGLPVLLAGVAIYLWCAWDFAVKGLGTPAPIDPPKALVVSGLYRHVRNPMYVGVLSVIAGEALVLDRALLLGYAALVGSLFHVFVLVVEEPYLSTTFGRSYAAYRANVRRWWPRLSPWEPPGEG